MAERGFEIDVNVSNLEAAITSLQTTMREMIGTMEELKDELEKIRTGTGFITGVDLEEAK